MKFMLYMISIIIIMLYIGINLCFLDDVVGNKNIKSYVKKIIFFILFFSLMILNGELNVLPMIICYYIVVFGYIGYMQDEISVLNTFWIIQGVSDGLSVFLVIFILGAVLSNSPFAEFYNTHSLFRIIIHLLTILFQGILLKIHIKKKVFTENLSNKQLLVSISIFIVIQLSLLVILRNIMLINNLITIEEYILIILLFIINLFFYKIVIFLSKEVEEKYLLEMNIKKMELEEKYIKEISQIYADIRSWKHDYRNNINVICNLAIANKNDEIFQYIKELDKEIIIAEAITYTGVFLIDSVVTSKYLYGNSKDINFSITAGKIEKGNILDFDLNIILSNLLDNAIEGAVKSKEKKVYINIFEKNNNIVFKIKNTFDGYVKKNDGNYITTKEENINGLGVKRVKNIINKYNGSIHITHANDIFESKVIIPIK